MQQQLSNSAVQTAHYEPTMIYTQVPIRSTTYDRYQHRQSIGLGTTQIIIGILCMIFNGVCLGASVHDYEGLAYVGHGFWCGALFILTGGLGIGAGTKKTRCLIVTFMVMCIISAVTTIVLLIIGIVGAVAATEYNNCEYYHNYNDYGYYYYTYPHYYPPCKRMEGYKVVLAMEASMAVLGFIAGLIAIWGSALCCGSGVCCCSRSTPPFNAPQPGYIANNGQVVYFNQSQAGQYIYLPQSMLPYSQGMVAPPYVAKYTQPEWIMPPPINNNDPQIGQAPPEYPQMLQVTSTAGQPVEQIKN